MNNNSFTFVVRKTIRQDKFRVVYLNYKSSRVIHRKIVEKVYLSEWLETPEDAWEYDSAALAFQDAKCNDARVYLRFPSGREVETHEKDYA